MDRDPIVFTDVASQTAAVLRRDVAENVTAKLTRNTSKTYWYAVTDDSLVTLKTLLEKELMHVAMATFADRLLAIEAAIVCPSMLGIGASVTPDTVKVTASRSVYRRFYLWHESMPYGEFRKVSVAGEVKASLSFRRTALVSVGG